MIATMSEDAVRIGWIEDRIRAATGDRVRGLRVEREAGRVWLHGRTPTRHAKQLALQAAMSLVECGEDLCVRIGVG
jgi:osmotically-inducible protein OsmY